jgi:hypothetical protein
MIYGNLTMEVPRMNQYGIQARQHWARWLPSRYKTIKDPETFFTELGMQTATQIADLMMDLAGDDPPGEDYLVKAGRLNMARLRAEEIVLPELILLPPEPEAEEAGSQPEMAPGQPGSGPGTLTESPAAQTPQHPPR